MANVANTKCTGPASKDAVSGGKKFSIKEQQGAAPRGNGFKATNSSDGVKSKIMSLKFREVDGQYAVTERDFKGKKLA